jgi:hypothetical protein
VGRGVGVNLNDESFEDGAVVVAFERMTTEVGPLLAAAAQMPIAFTHPVGVMRIGTATSTA